MKPTHHQTHQAGRHFAVAEALLRGHKAKLRGPQTYIEVNDHVAQVMVAGKGAWIIAEIDKFTALTAQTVVLVDTTDGARDVYVAPGNELRQQVRERHDKFLKRVGGTRPRTPGSGNTVIKPEHVEKWRDNWKLLS